MVSSQQFLPPPPPEIPLNVVPLRIQPITSVKPPVGPTIGPRPGFNGKRIPIITNHFKVSISSCVDDFFHYDVLISYEDGLEVTKRSTKMSVIDKLCETYKSELDGKAFIYDRTRSLFTPGPLPQNNLHFSVVLNPVSTKGYKVIMLFKCYVFFFLFFFCSFDAKIIYEACFISRTNENDCKRQRLVSRSTMFKVQMKFVSKIPMKSFIESKFGGRSMDFNGLRVLNTILQQLASKRGCLVLRQSFFENGTNNFIELGGGILGCRGLFSSFRALQGGLYLKHDVSITTIIQPGSVIDFLVKHQNVKNPGKIKWNEASRTLKNLRIKVKHLPNEFKITGLSEKLCKEQKFTLTLGKSNDGVVRTIETTVYDYFVCTRGIQLSFSANLPCINTGKPHKPTFYPIELCFLVPLQQNKKELTVNQKSAMITKCRQKPEDFIKVLSDDVKRLKLDEDPLLKSCGISINNSFVQVEGRVLTTPRLRMGNAEVVTPRNGWWNIKDKKFLEPKRLENWAIVKFSSSCDVRKMCGELARISSAKGMVINPPLCIFEENARHAKKPPSVRVDMMFDQIHSRFPKSPPQFILCLLSDKKFSDIYGPWKRKTIVEFGIRDQCIASSKIDELYLMNILMKINAKLGGFNHTVNSEITRSVPLVSKIPTMILGMEVSHSSPGRINSPSIASVVGSREWPKISSYRASVRTVPARTHMIDSLFKPTSQNEDAGIIRELLVDFYATSGQIKPAQIVIFRNGMSTSQFDQTLEVEMGQILKACDFLEEKWRPKFTVIVSQRHHHTKFFDANSKANVSPGTIVDSKVCDLDCNNFYVCAHAARIGTLRPTHYHVLLDEIGFSSDDLQELIHSLSYVFQRSNNTISEVAPVRYARLAAAKISQLIDYDKVLNTGYQLPEVHKNVSSSMFFI
ncbi:Protein argonaute 4 [Striga hermonthica]|uniref:Protein argonaute 4 n=1 Tax=Striga hermonthica TaxID=68872 RepID=A0A9N7MYY9_STRHE|nr:Protein argonaute 4 [Striga hermonthica]